MPSQKRILFICPHPVGMVPGQRLKYEQYFQHFEKEGFEVTVSSFMIPAFQKMVYKKGNTPLKIFYTIWGYLLRIRDLLRLPFYDGVYIFLWVTPFGPPIFEGLFCLLNKNIVYDIDDMVFKGNVSVANKWIRFLKGTSKMKYLMKKAREVITSTPYLTNYAKQFNSKITEIYSTVNTDLYIPVNQYTNNKPIVIGWSGSRSTAHYLDGIKPILVQLVQKHNCKILIMSDVPYEIEGVEIEFVKWSEALEIPTLQRMDIGLYPLPNEEWVLGKSGGKVRQYMALGVPTVATFTEANEQAIQHNLDGFLIHSLEEWKNILNELIINAELRKSIGIAARETVVNKYSVEANKGTYISILKRIVAKK